MRFKDKTLDEVAELLGMTPQEVLNIIVQRDRATEEHIPAAVTGEGVEEGEAALAEDVRSDEQLATYFLNRLQKESLSISALNNKYKVGDEERAERILENLVREGKLVKRESRNKKGRYVYEAAPVSA